MTELQRRDEHFHPENNSADKAFDEGDDVRIVCNKCGQFAGWMQAGFTSSGVFLPFGKPVHTPYCQKCSPELTDVNGEMNALEIIEVSQQLEVIPAPQDGFFVRLFKKFLRRK